MATDPNLETQNAAANVPQISEQTETLPKREEAHALTVVGIGASAGGIQALQEFFQNASTDSGSAFVVVLHLSPEHESHLAEVLGRTTTMPVQQVTEPVPVEANHVYVIPPAQQLLMDDGMLRLEKGDSPRGHRVAVDRFFRTLADAHGPHSIAVVLSGAGMDGSLGIKKIKEQGGLVVAQDPVEAEHDAMPRSAIATGVVDFVLPARDIARQIETYWNASRRMRLPQEAAPSLEQIEEGETPENALRDILAYVRTQTGHDFAHYKRATVLRRVGRRLQVNDLGDLPAYRDFLRQHPTEVIGLVGDLVISVTQFFRDPPVWEAVARDVLPRLFEAKKGEEELRVWVCACATGEEAYTVAILLLEQAAKLEQPLRLLVFATDMDNDAINYAREGSYPETIAADVSEERLRRWFYRDNGRYRICKEVREAVLFASHDVLRDTPFSRLDLVTCRNLLIYLNREAQERVFETFHFALRPDGRLLLGTAEVVDGSSNLFSSTDKQHRLYLRRPLTRAVPPLPAVTGNIPVLTLPGTLMRRRPSEPLSAGENEAPATPARLSLSTVSTLQERPVSALELHRALLELYAPPSILVNEDHQILHISNGAARYLQFSAGEPTANLLRSIRPELRLSLSSALYAAASENTDQVRTGEVTDSANIVVPLRLVVRPIQEPETARGYFLVLFEPADADVALRAAPQPAPSVADNEMARHLEQEITRLKNYVGSSDEQHEAAMEQFKAANEELQAMNEELRSTTEELETSKEELQSINEELTTVNSELKVRVDEVNRVNSDLQNLFTATDIATIFLDRALRIKRYTPSVEPLFNLISTDIGRPLSDLRHELQYKELTGDAERVLRTLIPTERETTSTSGQYFLTRMVPYRTPDDRIEGVVISFVNITGRRQAELALRESEQQKRLILESAKDYAIFTLDMTRHVTSWSAGAQALFGYAENEVLGQSGDVLFTSEDRNQGEPGREAETAAQEGRAASERWYARKNDASRFYGSGSITPLRGEAGTQIGFVKVIRDLTIQKRAEDALRENEARQAFLLELADAIRPLSDAADIMATVTQAAMNHFKADRCYYCEIEGDVVTIRRDAHRADLPSLASTYSLSAAPLFKAASQAGHPLVVRDFSASDIMDESLKQLCRSVNILSFINIPITKNEQLVGNLCLTQCAPREWTEAEIDLVNETAERTWVTLERVRAEEALAQSEEKYRTLFDSIDEGFSLIELIFDDKGKVVDYWLREANPMYERLTGLRDAVGKRGQEVLPNIETEWLEKFELVYYTGESVRFEYPIEQLGRFYTAHLSRVGGEGSRFVTTVFDNITARKSTEANVAFLAEVSQDLAHITNIEDTMRQLGAKIGRFFNASLCAFGEVDEASDAVRMTHSWNRPDVPSILGIYRLSEYVSDELRQAARRGETIVIRDVGSDARVNAENTTQLGIQSYITVPFTRGGKWLFMLAVYDVMPRDWRDDEIELISELTTRVWTRLERSRAEEALRESETRLREMADAVPHLMWLSKPEGGVLYYNRRFYEYSGLSDGEAQERGWEAIVHPDDLPGCLETRKQSIEAGEPWQYDYRLRRVDGQYRWHRGRAMPIGSGETVVHWVGTATDIDDETRAAEALYESEQALRQVNEELEQRVTERTGELARMSQLRQELLRQLVSAQEEERGRIARDLHDDTGQQVASLLLGLKQLKTTPPVNTELKAQEAVGRIEAIAKELAQKSHRLSFTLRPTALDDLGLVAALQNYTEEWSRWSGMPVEVVVVGFDAERLPPEVETTVYRVVQEALTNVLRHANHDKGTTQVNLLLQRSSSDMRAIVEDDGPGFDVEATLNPQSGKRRLGLFGMQERAALVSGTLNIESEPGAGTSVFLRVPLS